jgi:predicted negative regulator of RcsB-dependent stress response
VAAFANWPLPPEDFQNEWINLGILSVNAKQPEQALVWLERGTPDDRGEWDCVRGDALVQLRRFGDARDAYAAALGRNPANSEARAKLAWLHANAPPR